MGDVYTYGEGHEVEVVGHGECPTCDYGVAPLTANGSCLNCYIIERNVEL